MRDRDTFPSLPDSHLSIKGMLHGNQQEILTLVLYLVHCLAFFCLIEVVLNTYIPCQYKLKE